MPSSTIVIPRVQACAWFEEDPLDPRLAPGSGGGLDLTWGPPEVAFVEPIVRRRLSRLARGFFHCAQRLSPAGDVRVVFASRHGEAQHSFAILQELAAQREVSPNLFSMAVHNAVPGLWSILKGNHAPITAVAAGAETFGWGLVEAAGALAAEPGSPVLYVYADDQLPPLWAAERPQPGLHAVALLLGGEGPRLTFQREPGEAGALGHEAHQFLGAWREGGGAWGRWRGSFE